MNRRELLAAATDRYVSCVDVVKTSDICNTSCDGLVSLLMRGTCLVNGGKTVKDMTFKEEEWCDIVNETAEAWYQALHYDQSEAKLKSMTDTGCDSLRMLTCERRM